MQQAMISIGTTARNPLQKEQDQGDSELLTVDQLNEERGISTNTWAALMFIGYLILGMLFYCFARHPGLSALDSIYLSVITFLTIGYGDVPIYNRYFSCFYVLLGVGVVGTYFGLLTNDVMEQQEASMQKRLLIVARKLDGVLLNMHNQFQEFRRKKIKEYFSDVLAEKDSSKLTNLGYFKKSVSQLFLDKSNHEVMSEFKKSNMEAYDAELAEIRSKGIVDFFFVLVALLAGAYGMMWIENWTWEQSLYWTCVTVTTVGYGDVTPHTTAGKSFTIVYALIGCALVAKGFRDVVCYPLILRAKKNEAMILEQFGDGLSEKRLKAILQADLLKRIPRFQQDSSGIYKSEFMLLLLRMMNKVQEKDIIFASEIFDRLDLQKDGILSEEDQKEQIEKARQRDKEKKEKELIRQQEQAEQITATDLLNRLNPLSHLTKTDTQSDRIPLVRRENQRSSVTSQRGRSSSARNANHTVVELDEEQL